MTLRILHVGKFFPPYMGGMEVFLADLIEAQRSQGIEAFALVHGTHSQTTLTGSYVYQFSSIWCTRQ